jgi:NADP-dependent 3-hydroxy acid dehydrogenase YdfG
MTTVVLITGCSTGIGKYTALEFASNPQFTVWATMRDPTKWDQPPIDNVTIAPLDVTSEESVTNLVNQIIEKEGKIDILVNNAGYGLGGYIESVTIDEAKAQFDTNVWGVVRMCQAVLPYMRKAMSGYIINLSSTSGIRGFPCYEFYTGQCKLFSFYLFSIFVLR